MANDLEYTVGLNVNPLQQAGKALGRFGDDSVALLNKKFGAMDLFKGFLQGAGIASITQVVDRLVAPFKESAEAAKAISDWTDRAADATEKLIALRQNDAQQLAAMEKSARRIAQEIEDITNKPATQKFFGFIERGSAIDKAFGFSRREDATRAQQLAEKAADSQQQAVAIEQKKIELADKSYELEMRNAKARMDYVKANREQVELEAKALTGSILPAERARLDVLQQQQKVRENEQRIQGILEIYPEQRTQQEKATLQQLFRQRDLLGRQLTEKERILAATQHQAAAEARVGDVIESNIAKWKEFTVLVQRMGRDDRDLSDRELRRKLATLSQDVAAREAGQFQTGAYDGMLYFQRIELSRAQAEQQLRDRTRRDIERFGEDRAFMRSGLSEDSFAALQRTGPDTSEQAATLREIRDMFRTGRARVGSIPFGTPAPSGG